ncbi:MAG TPA: TOBE domain-containing protein [Syntrophomonas sp.]|nr:TOBE domain-containing protein [Syntrophomonas sp.]
MQLSARNQLKGKITDITEGPVSTEVVLDVNGSSLVASITSGSAKSMGLKVGDNAVAIIKASTVIIGK